MVLEFLLISDVVGNGLNFLLNIELLDYLIIVLFIFHWELNLSLVFISVRLLETRLLRDIGPFQALRLVHLRLLLARVQWIFFIGFFKPDGRVLVGFLSIWDWSRFRGSVWLLFKLLFVLFTVNRVFFRHFVYVREVLLDFCLLIDRLSLVLVRSFLVEKFSCVDAIVIHVRIIHARVKVLVIENCGNCLIEIVLLLSR